MAKLAPWEAGYNPANFNYEMAKALEQSKADSPGDSPNPMGNERVNVGSKFADIVWPGGSPTNYALMLESKMQLDQGGGESGNVSIYATTAGDVQSIFGVNFRSQIDDRERGEIEYLYTMREPSGRGNPASLSSVLEKLGRSFGQEG